MLSPVVCLIYREPISFYLTHAHCSVSLPFLIPIFLSSHHPSSEYTILLISIDCLLPPSYSYSLAISFLFHFLHFPALVLSFPWHSCMAADLCPSLWSWFFFPNITPPCKLFIFPILPFSRLWSFLLAIAPSLFFPPSLAGSWPPSSLWSSLQSSCHLFLQENQVCPAPPTPARICVFGHVCASLCVCVC